LSTRYRPRHHDPKGAIHGARDEVLDLLRAKGDPGALAADERDTVVYVRQLMRTNRVEPAVFEALLS
jgi:hypothetical protein